MHCNKVEIVPPLTCAMQEKQQREFLFAVISIWQVFEVFVCERLGDFGGETLLCLVGVGGGYGVEKNKTGDECRCQF